MPLIVFPFRSICWFFGWRNLCCRCFK